MALKGDMHIVRDDFSFFMNETGKRGGVVSFSTVGSGSSLDQSAAVLTYAPVGSGAKPFGILLCDVVNIDQTRMHLNQHKDEVQIYNKVTVLTEGWVVTDQIASGITINPGDVAYVGNGGRITNVFTGGNHVAIGRFLSKKDEDGYAKVFINLP